VIVWICEQGLLYFYFRHYFLNVRQKRRRLRWIWPWREANVSLPVLVKRRIFLQQSSDFASATGKFL